MRGGRLSDRSKARIKALVDEYRASGKTKDDFNKLYGVVYDIASDDISDMLSISFESHPDQSFTLNTKCMFKGNTETIRFEYDVKDKLPIKVIGVGETFIDPKPYKAVYAILNNAMSYMLGVDGITSMLNKALTDNGIRNITNVVWVDGDAFNHAFVTTEKPSFRISTKQHKA